MLTKRDELELRIGEQYEIYITAKMIRRYGDMNVYHNGLVTVNGKVWPSHDFTNKYF